MTAKQKKWLCSGAMALVALLALSFWFAAPKLDEAYFEQHMGDMEKVVALAQAGELSVREGRSSPGAQALRLPLRYRGLSKGGTIYTHQENGEIAVFFHSETSAFDDLKMGFLYQSNDSIDSSSLLAGGKKPLREQWSMSYLG